MASESFDVTDDNGNNVTGTVEVFRDRKGKFYDPSSRYYKEPRYAEHHFEYFNTREACTIDRKVLSEAMQQALKNALEKFGISKPDAGTVERDVNASINATRQQCILNADKYVSNETFSSTNWETGKAVGNLTAKAYAAVPTLGGGIQTVVAREHNWPAGDVSALKNDDSTNARILGRRVVARDNNATSPSGPLLPTPNAGELPSDETQGIVSNKPVRYLSRKTYNQSQASASGATVPAVPFVPFNEVLSPDDRTASGDRFGNLTSSPDGIAPRNPNLPEPPSEPGRPLGIFIGNLLTARAPACPCSQYLEITRSSVG